MDQLSYRRHRFPPPALSRKRGSRERPGRVGFSDGSSLLPPTPLPAADHPARDLALSPLHPELTRHRDVEELLAERGLEVSCETVRRWVLKFGPGFARRLRRSRPHSSDRWHLGEMVVRSAGKRMDLWRAVDHEGEVLDMLEQRRRDRRAALRLMRKLLRKQGFAPRLLTTDKLGSYGAAFRHLRLTLSSSARATGEQSRQELLQVVRRRERKMQRFKIGWLCPAFSQHPCCGHNTFNLQRHLVSRSTLRIFRAEARQRNGNTPSQQHEL